MHSHTVTKDDLVDWGSNVSERISGRTAVEWINTMAGYARLAHAIYGR